MTTRVRGGMREVSGLALPAVLNQLSVTAMGFVDTAIVGMLGPTPMAAVGFAQVWVWTLFSFSFGSTAGLQTFVSQEDGAGRPRDAARWMWQAAYVVLPLSVAFVLLLPPVTPAALRVLGPSAEMQAAAHVYFDARIVGMIPLTVAFVVASFFRGLGDMNTPLVISVLANVVNAVATYGLVLGELGLPALGVAGAGIATVVGETINALLLVAVLLVRRRRYALAFAPPSAREIRRFARIGLPIGAQQALEILSFSLFSTLVARMGDASAAASQAFIILLSLSFMQMFGLSMAATTLVGRYIGERDLDAARRTFRSALLLAVAIGGGLALLFVTIPQPLVGLFTRDPQVLELGGALVLLGALYQLGDGLSIVTAGSLRGAGDTRLPFVLQTAFAWAVFLPGAYIFGVWLGGGLIGAWAAGLLHVGGLAACLFWRFRSGAWEQLRI